MSELNLGSNPAPETTLEHVLQVNALLEVVSTLHVSAAEVIQKLQGASPEERQEYADDFLEGKAEIHFDLEHCTVQSFITEWFSEIKKLKDAVDLAFDLAKKGMVHMAIAGDSPSDYNDWDLEAAADLGLRLEAETEKGSEA